MDKTGGKLTFSIVRGTLFPPKYSCISALLKYHLTCNYAPLKGRLLLRTFCIESLAKRVAERILCPSDVDFVSSDYRDSLIVSASFS